MIILMPIREDNRDGSISFTVRKKKNCPYPDPQTPRNRADQNSAVIGTRTDGNTKQRVHIAMIPMTI